MLKDYIEIKIAVPTDALPLAYVSKTSFCESWSNQYTAEDMRLYTDEAFSLESTERDINDAANTFLLAFMNGRVAGYAKLRRNRVPKELEGTSAIEIERVYALKEFYNKKIGYELMRHCLVIANGENYKYVWLGVNEFNHKAVNFYKRFDFEVFGRKPFQLGNTIDEDLMMKKKLG